ncbi:MAG: class I SAM-dependent DNA methyltransferase [Selenomonadaceae bacterium]|nr:class I SAM-dependent DNA methyltransferase [Selenomonadaceae bacterium]
MNELKSFIERWKEHGYEKGEAQIFWTTLLTDIFNVKDVASFIFFEQQINGKFIDARIPSTNVLIEQKSAGKDLDAAYLQAKSYDNELPYNKKSRWIVTCDFQTFQIYDMNKPKTPPQIIKLVDLPNELHRLKFLVDVKSVDINKQVEVSLKAGAIVARIYDALEKSYKTVTAETLISLNKLCVRLVFCLYAEDANIFKKNQFHDYMNSLGAKFARQGLIELFKVLNTPADERDEDLDDILAAFPYVNGGLFAEDNIQIPKFTDEIMYNLLVRADKQFNWSQISPTIFGAVFESTLNPVTRRSGGMHYTSIENIHKVIDPLFINELQNEFNAILSGKSTARTKRQQLINFQNKLASLKFLDPACGSGNFLTETYLSLRRLENEVLKQIMGAEIKLGDLDNPIKVSINQFYGIEINDFAVAVAKTALWIAESQMMTETSEIVHKDLDFLPLKTSATIVEANALTMDWHIVTPSVDYIMGNPPFVGHQWRTSEQVEDMKVVFHDQPKHGKLDYVCAWYKKASAYIKGTNINCAFVSTNSICQGESVATMWKPLFDAGIIINFAYRSFKWRSESDDMAQVHCVIIGFAYYGGSSKLIFDGDSIIEASNINGYLLDAPNVFIQSRGSSLQNMPKMTKGSQPTDGGHLILTPDERDLLIKKYPAAKELVKQYVGADEFINNKLRYCLWLKDVPPNKYSHIKFIMDRLTLVAEARRKSATKSVREAANTPYLFTQIRQPDTDYLVVPRVSSERRKYIPLGYMTKDIICSDRNCIICNATLYIFGILTSSIHNSWMRLVAGRLEMRYDYSPAVYNNFVWPNPTDKQHKKIEQTAQSILDARNLYPDSSLADLYDERTMPPELRKAHQLNDRAVLDAYAFDHSLTESEIVAELMKLYKKLTS